MDTGDEQGINDTIGQNDYFLLSLGSVLRNQDQWILKYVSYMH